MIEIVNGDLLKSNLPLIAHQTNCLGVMGGGIAKAIRNKWPIVYDQYLHYCNEKNKSRALLGNCQICVTGDESIPHVANLFGEYSFTEAVAPNANGRHTDYHALKLALLELKHRALRMDIHSIGIPYKLGCGLAGGDWDGVVYPMIQEIFKDDLINLFIYKL